MPKPIFEAVLFELENRRGEWPDICTAIPNITYWWLTKVAQRKIVDPGVTKIQALYDYFQSHPSTERTVELAEDGAAPGIANEAQRVAA